MYSNVIGKYESPPARKVHSNEAVQVSWQKPNTESPSLVDGALVQNHPSYWEELERSHLVLCGRRNDADDKRTERAESGYRHVSWQIVQFISSVVVSGSELHRLRKARRQKTKALEFSDFNSSIFRTVLFSRVLLVPRSFHGRTWVATGYAALVHV
ncbi:hypothetical protein E4U55_003978 [Claviceps digitariae]|nr:hypothetical protein E4U55_003978 [Claviceps digitariae]